MQLGIVGAGRIGTNHAKILDELAEVESLVITDVEAGRAEQLATSLRRASAGSLEDVFARCDALVIASSTNTHADLLVRAAERMLPTFCEKPIALDLASTRRAVAAVEAAGISVQMGFQRRYDPGIREIRQQVETGAVGTLFLVRSQTHDPAPPHIDYIPTSGGIFKDCLIHDIDAVRYVTGERVVAVTAFGTEPNFKEILISPPLRQLEAAPKPLRYISVSKEAIDKVNAKFGTTFLHAVLPAGKLPKQTGPLSLGFNRGFKAAHPDFPEDAAYQIVMAVARNAPKMKELHALWKIWSPELMLHGLSEENVHPGAKRAYVELGWWDKAKQFPPVTYPQ